MLPKKVEEEVSINPNNNEKELSMEEKTFIEVAMAKTIATARKAKTIYAVWGLNPGFCQVFANIASAKKCFDYYAEKKEKYDVVELSEQYHLGEIPNGEGKALFDWLRYDTIHYRTICSMEDQILIENMETSRWESPRREYAHIVNPEFLWACDKLGFLPNEILDRAVKAAENNKVVFYLSVGTIIAEEIDNDGNHDLEGEFINDELYLNLDEAMNVASTYNLTESKTIYLAAVFFKKEFDLESIERIRYDYENGEYRESKLDITEMMEYDKRVRLYFRTRTSFLEEKN